MLGFALLAAGCHRNNLTSGYGVAWTTLTEEPGDFAAYMVTVDSVTLTGKLNGVISAVAIPEVVDFAKLRNISELWASASVPNDTYTQATITLDYTSAHVSVLVDGVPTKATVIDPATGAAATTISVIVTLDPANQLTILPTYASTDAQRFAIDFDLAASNIVNIGVSPPTVTIRPFFSVATSAADNKLIRIRGPLVNSSVNVGTYSVYIRPFTDEVNTAGSLSLFANANTIYTLDGTTYVGPAGITALSQTSAGTTMTAAFTTFQPTTSLTPPVVAGIFTPVYVVAGSSLEDFYTDGLEGDVIARSGNTLTLRGTTLVANAAEVVQFNDTPDANVIVGPGTIVTADDVSNASGLNYLSIGVGQHITARGIYTLVGSTVTLDSTGTSATNTGSVRLQPTAIWGPLVSTATGGLVVNLQAINEYPVGVYNFSGNGASAAQDSNPAAYLVNTGAIPLPAAIAAGDPLFIDGFVSPFGSAPPDFNAITVNAESSATAQLRITWSGAGTSVPFSAFNATGLTVDLSNPALASGQILVGGESIDINTVGASPQIVAVVPTANGASGLLPMFQPLFGFGSTTGGVQVFNNFATFQTQLSAAFAATTPGTALFMDARGTYDRVSNIFTAATVNVVL